MSVPFVGIALSIAASTLGAPPAAAHATLLAAVPPANGTVASPPEEVVLSFSEPVDEKLSMLRVLAADGRDVTAAVSQTIPGDAKRLRVRLEALARGTYVVTWRVLSTVDGHVTGGTLAFGVGEPPAATGAVRPVADTPGATPLSVGSRLLFYAGVMLLVATTLVPALVLAAPASRSAVSWSGALAAAGAVGLAESQRRESGASLGTVLETSIGEALLWRLAPLAVILVLVVTARHRRAWWPVAAGAAAVVAIAAHVAFGHAAAGSLRWPKVAAQTTHFAAAAMWIGGLGAVVAAIRGLDAEDRGRALRRFSRVAGFALAAVVITGTVRAFNETGGWAALLETGFGRVVVAKGALLAVIAGLGAALLYRHVPHPDRHRAGLLRLSIAEISVAVVVLALTGIMASIAPGRTARAAAVRAAGTPAAIVTTGADFATSVRARLEVDPGLPGKNRFVLRLTDYDSADPIDARRVAITFSYVGRTDVLPSTLDLRAVGRGRYAGEGANLGVGGPWSAVVLVEQGATSVEIPLAVATRSAQEVRATRTEGQPTLYDVDVSSGSAQFYVDPPRRGRAEVHATFFDARGSELSGLTGITLVATGPSGTARLLPVRLLSPGHFVADVTLVPGRWRFDVTATSPQGDLIWAYFEEDVQR